MAARTLQDELLAVAGVAEVDVDTDDGSPAGVRVRLSPEADAAAVGAEVQRILAAHGMRSRLAGSSDVATPEDMPPPPEAAPPSPVSEPVAPPTPGAPEPEPSPEGAQITTVTTEAAALPGDAGAEAPPPGGGSAEAAEPADPPRPAATPASRLGSLRVDETLDGVTVTATTTDGRSLSQRAVPTEEGTFEATVAAVGTLADGSPPSLLGIQQATIEGSEVVTVVLGRNDGTRFAGAAVVRAARPFAVAAATWAALRG